MKTKNKIQHTPGPYTFEMDSKHSFLISSENRCIAMSNETEVLDNGMSINELKANGKLLASAPVLLEALKQFIYAVEHEGEIYGRIVDAVRNANEAINKATGK